MAKHKIINYFVSTLAVALLLSAGVYNYSFRSIPATKVENVRPPFPSESVVASLASEITIAPCAVHPGEPEFYEVPDEYVEKLWPCNLAFMNTIDLPAAGLKLVHSSVTNVEMGNGWKLSPIDAFIVKNSDTALTYYQPSGKFTVYTKAANESVWRAADSIAEPVRFTRLTSSDGFRAEYPGKHYLYFNRSPNGSFKYPLSGFGDRNTTTSVSRTSTKIELTNPYGQKATIVLSNGRPYRMTDYAGRTYAFANQLNKLIKVGFPDGSETYITYVQDTDLIQTIKHSSDTAPTQYTYALGGGVAALRFVDSPSEMLELTYSASEMRIKDWETNGTVVGTFENGRLASVTDALGLITDYLREDVNNPLRPTAVVGPYGDTTLISYYQDSVNKGRPHTVSLPSEVELTYSYNNGNLTTESARNLATDATRVTTYTWDGDLLKSKSLVGQNEYYGYDAKHVLVQRNVEF